MVGIARRELPWVELLRLDYRGGLGLGGFYGRAGWTEVGRVPAAALRLSATDYRDDVAMAVDGVSSAVPGLIPGLSSRPLGVHSAVHGPRGGTATFSEARDLLGDVEAGGLGSPGIVWHVTAVA